MIAVWSKIRVTAFRREGFIARPVPEQDGFTQTGPRRNERNCLLLHWRGVRVQGDHLIGMEEHNAVRHRLEVVEQLYGG